MMLCKRGHNEWRVRPDGKRECTACRRETQQQRRQEQRAKRGPLPKRQCPTCLVWFTPKRANQRHCDDRCNRNATYARRAGYRMRPGPLSATASRGR